MNLENTTKDYIRMMDDYLLTNKPGGDEDLDSFWNFYQGKVHMLYKK